LCPGAGFVVLGFGPSASIPINRINRRARLRSIGKPSSVSVSAIRRAPKNGRAVNSASMRRIASRSLSLAGRRLR
jgi:hypothetical protein